LRAGIPALRLGEKMKEITYGTGATRFSDGSSRLMTTLGRKKSRIRKKRKKRKINAISRSLRTY
tara:strand:- start:2563 stop:2754 length:192 start_codon:yes stop_codon:yes gene_type:complete